MWKPMQGGGDVLWLSVESGLVLRWDVPKIPQRSFLRFFNNNYLKQVIKFHILSSFPLLMVFLIKMPYTRTGFQHIFTSSAWEIHSFALLLHTHIQIFTLSLWPITSPLSSEAQAWNLILRVLHFVLFSWNSLCHLIYVKKEVSSYPYG